jgi:hypothetical protein
VFTESFVGFSRWWLRPAKVVRQFAFQEESHKYVILGSVWRAGLKPALLDILQTAAFASDI